MCRSSSWSSTLPYLYILKRISWSLDVLMLILVPQWHHLISVVHCVHHQSTFFFFFFFLNFAPFSFSHKMSRFLRITKQKHIISFYEIYRKLWQIENGCDRHGDRLSYFINKTSHFALLQLSIEVLPFSALSMWHESISLVMLFKTFHRDLIQYLKERSEKSVF